MPVISRSCRRHDAQHTDGRLGDFLRSRFGSWAVFLDLTIGAGRDFARRIQEAIDSSQAMLVVIWRESRDAQHERRNRRLDDRNDYVPALGIEWVTYRVGG